MGEKSSAIELSLFQIRETLSSPSIRIVLLVTELSCPDTAPRKPSMGFQLLASQWFSEELVHLRSI